MHQHVLHSWNLALVSHERPSPILKMLRATSCLAQLQSRPQWISAPRSCHDSTNSLMSRHPTIRPMLVFLAWPPLSGSRQLQGVPEALEGPIQALKNSDRPAAQHHMLMLESFMLPRCILRSIFPFVFRGSFLHLHDALRPKLTRQARLPRRNKKQALMFSEVKAGNPKPQTLKRYSRCAIWHLSAHTDC